MGGIQTHRTNPIHDWTRRRFLTAAMISAGAVLLPTAFLRAEVTGRVRRHKELWAMGGWNYLQVECDSREAALASIAAMVEAIRQVDRTFSVFEPSSPLSSVNSSKSACVSVDDEMLLASISESLRWAHRLDGAFDPTVEPLMRRCGFRETHRLPHGVEASPERDWDYRRIECDQSRGQVRRESSAIKLDSGGWAKGLAAEMSARAGMRSGASSVQVSCGGDIFKLDSDPEWECSIRDPLGDRGRRALRVRHQYRTVATSGDAEIYRFSPDGRRIGHLMDPRTGDPADSDLLSVSVFGQDGLAADAVSSALFVMGKSEGLSWLRANPEFGAVMIDKTWPGSHDSVIAVGDLEVGRA